MPDIDISSYFSPEAINQAFYNYKEAKTGLLDSDSVRIPMGADGVTWENFEKDLERNVNRISQRVLVGKYNFYAFREVAIPKPNGDKRILSIAGIRDALVQRQLYEALYQSAEEFFSAPQLDQVSFAYRKGKSAPCAAQKIWQAYNDGYKFALDADIKQFFDTLDHNRLKKLLNGWVGEDTIPGRLLWRFVRTDRVPYDSYKKLKYFFTHKPTRLQRKEGVPQGGVLSGMLANLYLYEFDQWVIFDLNQNNSIQYIRYADDFVILTKDEKSAMDLLDVCSHKLRSDFLIEMHTEPPKTKISNISNGDLEFVGFHFTKSKVRARESNIEKFKQRYKRALRNETKYKTDSFEPKARLNILVTYCINPRILGIEPTICENCGYPETGKRNWMAFFSQVVTDTNQLKQLDRWMRRQLSKYFWRRYRRRLKKKDLRDSGMKTLIGEYYDLRRNKQELCECKEYEPELDDEEWLDALK